MCALRRTGIDQVTHVVNTNRQMLEKALLMRGQSYLADVKAQLLTGVIQEMDSSRKRLLTAHQRLKESMHTVSLQKDLLALEVEQRVKSEETAHGARLQAEAANRARAQFLANISHDVLTPLNAINAYAEMIDDEILGPVAPAEYKNYAGDIRRASAHLHDLVRSLLETARVEAGQLRITASEIDLVELLHDTLAMLDHQAKQKDITLTNGGTLDTLPIHADAVLLRRLMLNLTTNALKFTEAGGRVSVSAEAGIEGGSILRISDNGPGIAAQDIETALTPYERINGTSGTPDDPGKATTSSDAGLGLGLPMAKAIAEAHGGTLGIKSVVGDGTTVTVTLPKTRPGQDMG